MEEGCVPDITELFCFSQVFPNGLPEEFTLIFTLALKKAALRDTIYLFQISDQQGYPQVHLTFCFLIACFLHIFHSSLPLSLRLSLPLLRCIAFYSTHLLLIHPSLVSSLFCIVIHFPLRFLLSGDIFSIPSPFSFHAPFVLSYSSSGHPLFAPCLSVIPLSIIFCSPISFTFIVIHVFSMMKNWSLPVSP